MRVERTPAVSANSHAPKAQLRVAELVMSLSLATDLGIGMPMEYALHSCLLGVRLGEQMGLGDSELSCVYYLTLLRFIGCTADQHLDAEIWGDELAVGKHFATLDMSSPGEFVRFALRNVGGGRSPVGRLQSFAAFASGGKDAPKRSTVAHCEVAENLAGRLGFGLDIVEGLWQLFERWDGKGLPVGLKGEEMSRSARIARFAQDAETFHRLGGIEAVVAMAKKRSGGAYDPSIVEQFCSHADTLLMGIDTGPAWEMVLAAEPGERRCMSEAELDEAARAMGDFADLKSPLSTGHSGGVAALAESAARQYGLPESDAVMLRRAGHLHDVGRVGVSASIWEKRGSLNESEWERVRLHPYYTERILARATLLQQLGSIAALHHERLDGSGYHRGLPAPMLPPAARILSAADAYHAMRQPRPYRHSLSPDEAAAELRREVRAGKLDGDAVRAVLSAAGHKVPRARSEHIAGLSDREIEVLRLLSRGLSNKQMARALSITDKTVDHHVQHIYAKIGVSTRAAATMFAMQHQLG